MSDTPQTEAVVRKHGKLFWVPANFARKLERENNQLRSTLGTAKRFGWLVTIALAVLCLSMAVLLITGCTLGNETPAERKAQKVLEPQDKVIFRDGKWEGRQ